MNSLGLESRELSPALGVEVQGLDVRRPPGEEDARELRRLFDRHHLLLFRGEEIDDEAHLRLCRALLPVSDPFGYISNLDPAGYHPEVKLLFHSDFTFTPHPLDGISLYAVELGPGAAPTRFANAVRAARELPRGLRARLEGLEVVMLANIAEGREDIAARCVRVGDDAPTDLYPRIARPALLPHPRTGTPLVLASEQQASHFVGLSLAESDALLDALFSELYADANVYEHVWRPRDLLIWDNLALQHGRRENPRSVRRCLRRVTMSPRPFLEIVAGTVYAQAAAGS